jgi:hypothetical protein
MNAIARAALLPALAFAMDDQPLYLDAGCDTLGIPGTDINGGLTTVQRGGKAVIPTTCTGQLTGTDAISLKAAAGGWWNAGIKTPTDRSIPMKGYADVRFWVKNRAGAASGFTVEWQTESWSFTQPAKEVNLVADSAWHEIVVPLTDFSGSDTAVKALYLRNLTGMPKVDALIDSITITDGTGNGSLNIGKGIAGPLPTAWPSTFLVGGFDKTEIGKATKAYQSGNKYRYQYVMKETYTYWSPSSPHTQMYVYDYAKESDTLGVKSGFVWYNLGKSGEGYTTVLGHLAATDYMDDYFTRYDWLLDQMVQAGQHDYILVLEPDMYGILMRGVGDNGMAIPTDDPHAIPVNMTKANSLSGTTWEPDLNGWAKYMMSRARTKLANQGVILGHMPNHWGVNIPGQVGRGRKEAHLFSGMTIARFLNNFDADAKGDVVFVEKTDYDAGTKGQQWFWDSTCYAKFFLWTRAISQESHLPVVGWQMAEGNSTHPNSSERDDIVETFLAHPSWWTDGGFIGILFGGGNSGCANYAGMDDNGWFMSHMSTYNQTPYPLPVASSIQPRRFLDSKVQAIPYGSFVQFVGWSGIAQIDLWDLHGSKIWSGSLTSGQYVPLLSSDKVLGWRVSKGGLIGSGRLVRF